MDSTENPGRERILARMQQALILPSAKHSASGERKLIFAPIDNSLARFQEECLGNKTECLVVPDRRAGAAAIGTILDSLPAGEVFVQDSAGLREMASAWKQERDLRWSTVSGPSEATQATVTNADALVAATGSIFVSAACGGRGASVVAPVHIVSAGIEQMVPDLDEAFALLRARDTVSRNSFLCLITGSSRTADIEKILVMGAHGPRRLVVVLCLQTN
jgi:L-lactate dehydrogenase complex protein LldG